MALLSPIQTTYLLDESRFKVARCSRRAGKTYVDAADLIYTGTLFPKDSSIYLGLTRDAAKEAIWQEMLDMLERCEIPFTASEVKLEIKLYNGHTIRLFGADMSNVRDRFRGRKYRKVIVDECAFYAQVDDLVLSVLLATLADYQGSLSMTSSPGLLPKGLFYQADQGEQKENWARYHWTLLDNPHFQQPSKNPKFKTLGEEELDTICRLQFGGDRNHPVFRREYLGEWVFDAQSLVYPFSAAIKAEYPLRREKYALGLNLRRDGTYGAVVIKFSEFVRTVQVTETVKEKVKSLNDFARRIERLMEDYDTEQVYVFLGDKNPEIIEEFRHKYPEMASLQVSRYHKDSFYQSLIAADMLNDYVECTPDASDLINEFDSVVKDSSGVEVEDQETLLADAFYAVYLNVYQTVLKAIKEPEREEDRMERELAERAREEYEENQEYYENLFD